MGRPRAEACGSRRETQIPYGNDRKKSQIPCENDSKKDDFPCGNDRKIGHGPQVFLAIFAGLLLSASPGYAQATLADASRLIQEQDARLGSAPGTITLGQPSRLGSSVTLGAGHALQINAPLTVGPATIHLSGHNEVGCTAPVTVENATELFLADGATDLNVHGCKLTVKGAPGGYLLTATRGARVTMTGNQLVNMAIFNTHNTGGPGSRTTDVTITGNSTEFPRATGPIGIYLLYVIGGVVSNNRLGGTGHGIEWWGGDANEHWPGFQGVTEAGNLSITGNTCANAGGACVWGSDGFGITVSDNSADTCTDVCFDTEGGVRTVFTNNSAKRCTNGCLAAEFESQDVVFQGNHAVADGEIPEGPLVLIKHPSGRGPNHMNLRVTGNDLRCVKLCAALYSEGEDGFTFSQNTITNGFLQFINYTNNVALSDNTLRFAVPIGAPSAISGPALANGHHSDITGNTIVAEAGATGDGACISQGWSDYNSTDEMRILNNTCTGGFRLGILTATGGGNPGAPHAVWRIKGNKFNGLAPAQQIVHHHSSGNEDYKSQ